jgi:hypothetical protein
MPLLAPLLATALAVEAPVTSVTVYSDRARVTRTAPVPSGTRRVELPLLPDSADSSTIRLETRGVGQLERVDIAHVEEDDFPQREAAKLLAELEAIDDRIARLGGERAAAVALGDALRRLAPAAPPVEPLRAPPRLAASGWAGALEFVGAWQERLQAKVRDADERLADLGRERQTVAERARRIGGARRRTGWRVTASVGGGAGELRLSYVVQRARWYPTYDVQLVADKGRVQVAFGGLVSQETGEDWIDAALTLSTAVPATATRFPTLATWKIGERERFIPTPAQVPEEVRPPPHAAPPRARREGEGEALRTALLARAQATQTYDFDESTGEGALTAPDGAAGFRTRAAHAAAAEGWAAPPVGAPAPPMAAPAAPPPMPVAPSDVVFAEEKAPSRVYAYAKRAALEGRREEAPPSIVGLALAPPSAWTPPVFAAGLPASEAGGYDLSYRTLRAETIRSGQGARRVALFSESWPVSVERKLFPALAPDAYLVAEIKNPLGRPLPGGQANLFVGADPAGVAKLSLVAPGQTFTLPLGIDRAVRPVRNVKLLTEEKGVIAKDELSTYAVTIEVANPYPMALPVRILDQVPLSRDQHVEVKLLKVEPRAEAEDRARGSLEWRLALPASGRAQVSFVYSVRRPKGWRLHQSQ